MDGTRISLREELSGTLKLAWPIVLSQVGHMSMGMVDTLIGGRLGTTELAGLALASNFFWTFTSVCMGCLLALDTYFSQAIGAGNHSSLSRYLSHSWWTCIILTLASGIVLLAAAASYLTLAPASGVRETCGAYLKNVFWCLPTLFIFFVLQRYWQARHRVLPFTVILIGANILNLFASIALGLGHWGFPRMGVQGLALATVVSRYAMLAAAIWFTWRELSPTVFRLPPFEWVFQRRIFRLGLPAAGQTGLEVGAFTIATFAVSALGAAPLAAHHVCLMMAAFTFMFPLGFSAAAAVRVGTYIGAGDPRRARLAGWLCIGLSVSVMSFFAAGYLIVPRMLLGLFTQDSTVVEYGLKILMLVALFQVADGMQVSATGALRGLGNTRAAMLANLVGHYPVGLALGFAFCFIAGFGVVGMWAGLAAGLITVAIILIRIWILMTRDPAKLQPLAVAQDQAPSL